MEACKTSQILTFVMGIIVTFLVTHTVGQNLCPNGSDFMWRRYQDRCDTIYFCFLGRAVTFTCPQGQVVGANRRFCVPENSELDDCTAFHLSKQYRYNNVPATCKPGERYPSEESCAKYSECVSSGKSKTSMLEHECPYPELFDVTTKKCSPFTNVKCEVEVFEPKNPCEYDANKCQSSAHCIPCDVRYPSCAGLPDGMNPWQGKEWSPHYVVCQEERISYQGMCKGEKESQIFHPEKRTCVHFDEIKSLVG